MTASGRLLPVVALGEFVDSTTCYAGLTDRDRPRAVLYPSYRKLTFLSPQRIRRSSDVKQKRNYYSHKEDSRLPEIGNFLKLFSVGLLLPVHT